MQAFHVCFMKFCLALNGCKYNMKEGDTMVELDQFKYTLSTFEKPLVEVRDSL